MITLFYDIGSISTTVSVVEYSQNKEKNSLGNIKVLGVASDEKLGGAYFDNVLANYFAEKFIEKYKQDPRVEKRPATRLVEEAQRLKHILSANNEAHLSIESLYNDRDLSMKVTREDFEKLSESLLLRLVDPIKEALITANLTMDDIDYFEMSGGSSRIPAIQERLSKFANKLSLSYSLNADEAIAMGASFFGASNSPSFHVKTFKLVDITPYQINFALSGSDKDINLFNSNDEIDSKKTITVPRTEDFSITLKYSPNSIPKSYTTENSIISTYQINGVTKTMSNWTFEDERGKKKKVKATFKLNRYGLVELDSVNAILEETVTVRVETNDTIKDGSNETKPEPTYKKDTKTTKVDLDFKMTEVSLVKQLTPEQLKASREKINNVEKYESLKRKISAARNTLEATLYGTRDKILDNPEFKPYFTVTEQNNINKALDELEVWLSDNYDEGTVDQSVVDTYNTKLRTITDFTNPIHDRHREHRARKEVVGFCKNIFNVTNQAVKYMKDNQKHITDEERQELLDLITEKEKYLSDTISKQDKLPLFEAPTVLAAEIKKECGKVSERTLILAKKPVPKPETTIEKNETVIPPQSETQPEEVNQEETEKKDEL
ncbi:predicted protein [Naegleria gruberi]|uniref:Predicted protein n=1 Tax=Naegleria gruberi TaxID=5762 RepID=D2UXT5_NAEGR|nr:uncharacterized protein NAEGRDRAFT_29076 [Naegleria gruberi]EFC50686.1 predicted protein [Naegleria gruberi]|eukprot:XP_002683430.1 predicted protein [Naegleria gruberi strain NEG-M]